MELPWASYRAFTVRVCSHLTPFGVWLLMQVPFVVTLRNGVVRVNRARLDPHGVPYYRQVLQIDISDRAHKIYKRRFIATPSWAD
jgi:hypothetical protein